jgi:hypothetical protein
MMVDRARRLGRTASWLLLIVLALTAPARAGITFGDIDITPPPARSQETRMHGYYEYVFLLTNQSTDKSHTVSLRLPGDRYIIRGDYLREVRRTVQLGPGETARVTLLQPDYPPVGGSGVAVFIDDRRQDRELSLTPNETRRGYFGYPGSSAFASYTGGPFALLILANPTIVFPKNTPALSGGMPPGMASGMAGLPGGAGPAPARPLRPPPGRPAVPPVAPPPGLPAGTEIIPAEPVEMWSTDWLAYSHYDGIVLTGDDLKAMPPAVLTTLWQYTETGGSLTVLGSAKLPESWVPLGARPGGFTAYAAGFGECLVHPDARLTRWDADRIHTLADTWARTAGAWPQQNRSTYAANAKFPIVEDLGIPIKGLFILMLLFTLAIGPVNFILLSRLKRRIWLLWTTPALSLVTCLAVLGYMLISEGWQGHLRTETLTVLDEASHRATTVGWTGVYSPLTPGDGLHFSYQTEVESQRLHDSRRTGVRSCTIDWSRDQHFASGWVEARVPAHFKVRKSELRRERVIIHREDGRLSMVNCLRAPIRRFWYADENGAVYTANEVPPGPGTVLTALDDKLPPQPADTMMMRQVFLHLNENWSQEMQNILQMPLRRLRPRSYLAELDDTPFFEVALPDARTRKCHSLVLGLCKKDDKAQ